MNQNQGWIQAGWGVLNNHTSHEQTTQSKYVQTHVMLNLINLTNT